jgi:polar amino acid transport system substrate-binding protein
MNLNRNYRNFPMPQRPYPTVRDALQCLTLLAAAWLLPLAHGATPAPAAVKPPVVVEAPVVPPPAMPPSSTLVKVADGRLLAPDIARIVNRGELIVAMLGVDSPPFFYTRNGELVGLEVDLAKAIAKELKVTVRFDRSAQTFNEVVAVVARQEADLGVSKLSRTLARAQSISFTDPYLRLNHAFILNRVKFAELARDRPLPAVIRGFKGSIGVIAKSSFADYAIKNFPNAEIREFPSWGDVLKALEKGQIMAAYRDEFEIKRLLKTDPTVSLTLRTVTFKDLEDSLGIAVGIQDPTLLAFVNQFLAESTEKLTIDKVLKAVAQ